MRAQALKRLAFVVLSSQMDQYSTYLPDIQGTAEQQDDVNGITNCTCNFRAPIGQPAPQPGARSPRASVRLLPCPADPHEARALRLHLAFYGHRTGTQGFRNLYNFLLQVQVLLQIEQQLSDKGATVASDDLKCSRDEQWMQLYLSACKLLETLCTLPSGYVAQFQMSVLFNRSS